MCRHVPFAFLSAGIAGFTEGQAIPTGLNIARLFMPMSRLTDAEKKELRTLIEADQPLPLAYRAKLFAREPASPAQAPK